MKKAPEIKPALPVPLTHKHRIFYAALIAACSSDIKKNDLKKSGKLTGAEAETALALSKQFRSNNSSASKQNTAELLKQLQALSRTAQLSQSQYNTLCTKTGFFNEKAFEYFVTEKLYGDYDGLLLNFIERSKDDCALKIIELNAFINSRDETGATPLIVACSRNNTRIAIALLGKKADPNAQNKKGESPLFLSIQHRNYLLTKALLQRGAVADCQDALMQTPLHLCAQNGLNDYIALLFEHKVDVDATLNEERTPLVSAIYYEHYSTAKLLVERYSANVNCGKSFHYNPLGNAIEQYMAYRNNNNMQRAKDILDLIQFLLEHHADSNRVFTESLSFPLNYLSAALFKGLGSEQLTELDYELVRLFTTHHFNYNNQSYLGTSFLNAILASRNLRLINSAQLATIHAQHIYKSPITLPGYATYLVSDDIPAPELIDRFNECLLATFSQLIEILTSAHIDLTTEQGSPTIPVEPTAQTQNNLANATFNADLANEIISHLNASIEKFKKYGAVNIPTWCANITLDRLQKCNRASLEELRTKLEHWSEKTLLNLKSKSAHHGKEKIVDVSPPTTKQETPVTRYEQTLMASDILMREINDSYSLLLPFNANGEIGLEVIADANQINPEDFERFQRVLNVPRLVKGPHQSGINFLTSSDYLCKVIINQQECTKCLVAEIKINSAHRIGLYLLNQTGPGKAVLALGPFIREGFHDKRYVGRVFQGHALDFSASIIQKVEQAVSKNQVTTSISDSLSLVEHSIWQTPPAAPPAPVPQGTKLNLELH